MWLNQVILGSNNWNFYKYLICKLQSCNKKRVVKGTFVNRELLVFSLWIVKSTFYFLLNVSFDNNYVRNENPVFIHRELWFSFMFFMIFEEQLQLQRFNWTAGYTLHFWNVILNPGPLTRGNKNQGNVSRTTNSVETRSERHKILQSRTVLTSFFIADVNKHS